MVVMLQNLFFIQLRDAVIIVSIKGHQCMKALVPTMKVRVFINLMDDVYRSD